MRILVSLVLLVGFSIRPVLEAKGEKKQGQAEKKKAVETKVESACKKSDLSGLVLEVFVPKKNIAGAPIACTVTLTNTSKETITYVHTTGPRTFVLEIKDLEGTVVPYTRYGKTVFEGKDVRFIQRELAPGESRDFIYDLTRCFDLTIAGDYSLSAVSRRPMIKGMRISVNAVRFSVTER